MKIFSYLFLFLFFSLPAASQTLTAQVSSAFIADTLQLDFTRVVQTALQLKNNKDSEVKVTLYITSPNNNVKISGSAIKQITLKPLEQLYLPVKAVYQGDKADPFIIKAAIADGMVRELVVLPQKIRNVVLSVPEKQVHYGAADTYIRFRLTVRNTGTTNEGLNLLVRWPESFPGKDEKPLFFRLKAASDTLIYIERPVTPAMLKQSPAAATVSLYYSNNDYIRSEQVVLGSVQNRHRFKDENENFSGGQFGLSAQYMSHFKELTYRLMIDQQLFFNDSSQLVLKANAEYWNRSNSFFLRNSLLRYSQPNFDMAAGSVSHTGELASNGRGVVAGYALKDTMRLQLGWLDKSYALTDDFNQSRGNTFWAGLAENKEQTIATSLYADTDRYSGIHKYILYRAQEVADGKNLKISYSQGLSMLVAPQAAPKPGILAVLDSYYSVGRFSWYGTHQAGSPHYAGMRRGMLLMQQKLSYRKERHLFDLSYNFYSHSPKALSEAEFFGINSQNQNFTVNYRFGSARWHYGLGSTYITEKQNFKTFNKPQAFESARINLQAQYSFLSDKLTVGTLTSAGRLLQHAAVTNQPFTFRTEWSVQYLNFRLSGSYQYNYHNIYETFMANPDREVYRYAGVNLSGTHAFMYNKVRFNWGVNYIENPQFAGLQLNGRLNWELQGGWQLYGGYYSSRTMYYVTSQSHQLEMGMVKKLQPVKLHQKKHDITVRLLYNDGSGVLRPAPSRKISVNNYVFVTDEDGTARFTKVPDGTYTLRAHSDETWMAAEEKVYVDQDRTFTVVLSKTTVIRGAVVWQYAADPYEVDKETTTFIVTATNSAGHRYRTLTNGGGRYALFLPEDAYELVMTPQKASSFFEIQTPSQFVRTSLNPVKADIEVLVKSREVETKKFNGVKF